jgi:hypothetical protein
MGDRSSLRFAYADKHTGGPERFPRRGAGQQDGTETLAAVERQVPAVATNVYVYAVFAPVDESV